MSWKGRIGAAANRFLRRFDVQIVRVRDHWRPLEQLGRQPPAGFAPPFASAFVKSYLGAAIESVQVPADFAVVMPTILRPTILDAVRSVFEQKFDGTVQLLIGIDAAGGDTARLEQACAAVPDRCSVLLFYPGYSTSRRNGGIHWARDGGCLRTVLSYLANSRYLAYLDDDNWWGDDHLAALYEALSGGAEWAYALRWFVHPRSRLPICRDEWESIGPDRGMFGGWVDPNCLALDKSACESVLRLWSIPLRNSPKAMDADRTVFDALRTEFRGAATGRHSVFYEMDEADHYHARRLSMIGEQRYQSCAQVAS